MVYVKIVKDRSEIVEEDYDVLYYIEDEGIVILVVRKRDPSIIYVGDILYEDTSHKLKTISPEDWTNALGTPLGVCVVPSTHMIARFIAVKGLGSDSSDERFQWATKFTDTALTNYTEIPCVGHDDSGNWTPSNTIMEGNINGFMSSDINDDLFATVKNTFDTKTSWAYNDSSCHIPSPFDENGNPNPSYSATTYSGGTIDNCLSNFEGKENTETLVNSFGDYYAAANVCYNYNPSNVSGVTQGDWYLPSIGELAYIMPRFEVINKSINKVGGTPLDYDNGYLSSTEYDSDFIYYVGTYDGFIDTDFKNYDGFVRPFVSPSIEQTSTDEETKETE